MLSYILPVDEKPPPGPAKGHLELALATEPLMANGRAASTPISKETSVSSFVSDGTATASSMTPTSTSEKGKPKLIINGKHPTLKRVSFGSSKGSMVETLIYETPVQEETEPSPLPDKPNPFPADHDQTEAEREKVRVSFFQQSKPQEVDLPDDPVICISETDYVMANAIANDANHIPYNRTQSTESGWDNPFQPGGDLSREADEIVQLIKGGKPITPTPGANGPSLPSLDQTDKSDTVESPKRAAELNATQKSANGNVQNDQKTTTPGAVEVHRGTAGTPGDASQVEHVTIKKKPKCKCCVIQ